MLRTMLRQLPSKTEMPDLLVDISQTALAAGIVVDLFQPGAEVVKEFYAEKPIQLKMLGTYHQFGTFISGVASLPRVVILTMHDVSLRPAEGAPAPAPTRRRSPRAASCRSKARSRPTATSTTTKPRPRRRPQSEEGAAAPRSPRRRPPKKGANDAQAHFHRLARLRSLSCWLRSAAARRATTCASGSRRKRRRRARRSNRCP